MGSLGLVACGDDEEVTVPPVGSTGEAGLESPPTTEPETRPDEPTDLAPPPEDDNGTGGAGPPAVSDEAHEGGGPDPGTGEGGAGGEAQQDNPSGGAGPSPTESFEQFCEENPSACE